MSEKAMKQTSIRFGRDLWALLEEEAALVGVSVSQYIREAALARASAAGVARGQEPFDLLAGAPAPPRHAPANEPAGISEEAAAEARLDARALRAESEQARSMARQVRARHQALRDSVHPPKRSP
jgi:hypothetical protein